MKYINILSVITICACLLTACKNEKTTSNKKESTKDTVELPEKDLGPVTGIKLSKLWSTDSTLITPESVLFDEVRGVYYVSCIGNVPPTSEDGDGFIATLDQKGNILNNAWVTGMDAPKGMALKDGKLYVTDINELVIIDQATAQIVKKIEVPESAFLNDVALAPDGKVYFTDSQMNTIYVYNDDKVKLYKKDNDFGGANGILVDDETIYIAGFRSGDILTIDIDTKEITKRAEAAVPGGDGIAPWQGGYIFSNWNGEAYFVNPKWTATKVLDTKTNKENAADITINQKNGELLVPTFFDNRVVSYKIENIR